MGAQRLVIERSQPERPRKAHRAVQYLHQQFANVICGPIDATLCVRDTTVQDLQYGDEYLSESVICDGRGGAENGHM